MGPVGGRRTAGDRPPYGKRPHARYKIDRAEPEGLMNEWSGRSLRDLSHEALRALGVDDLILAVHDASFPSEAGEDSGRGTPYSRGARRLCEFADGLGFTGLQLGPQG